MNVLVISQLYPNKTNTMLGIFVRKQIAALKKQYGNELTIKVIVPVPYTPYILSKVCLKYKNYYDIPKEDKIDDIEIYYPRVMFFPRNINFEQAGFLCYLSSKGLINRIYKTFKFDLIHAHVAFPSGYAAMLLNKTYKKPLVVTIHGQDINYTIKRNRTAREKIINTLEAAQKVVFVSQKLKRETLQFVEDNLKFQVIHNAIDLEDVCKDAENIKKQYPNQKILLSAGNLIKTKGNDLTIKAFAHLCEKYENLILIIIGKGEEEQNLKKLCEDMGVENKVIFTGQLPHSKVMEYMEACDLFVLPSFKEGFGIVYIEAMSHGKCVVGCLGEGIQDVIEKDKDGILVKPNDLNDLIENLELLFKEEKRMHQIGKNAEQKIKESFTLEKNAKKVMEIYKELIGIK